MSVLLLVTFILLTGGALMGLPTLDMFMLTAYNGREGVLFTSDEVKVILAFLHL